MFAIIILSIIGGLYRSGHEEFVGSNGDPEDGKAVAGTIFTAVIVYAVRSNHGVPSEKPILTGRQVFVVFCGLQGLLHVRENRRGAISL